MAYNKIDQLSRKKIIGLFYPDIEKGGGYPRDILKLFSELQNQSINVNKLTTISQLYRLRNDLKMVHVFGFFQIKLVVVILICKLYKIPYVITTFSHLMPYALAKGYLKKIIFIKSFGIFLLKGAKIIHVFTETEKKSVENFINNAHYNIISLGIYPEDISSISKRSNNNVTDTPYLLFLGRLDVYQKGIDLLIEGYTEYIESGGRLKLIICGRDWDNGKKFILNRLKSLNIKEINFLGEVDENKMNQLILDSVAFIYPSRFDGPPRPLRRALLLEKKVLASYQSNLYEGLENKGWGLLFDANAKSICETIIKFENLNDFEIYQDPMEVLSWNIISKEFGKMYASII